MPCKKKNLKTFSPAVNLKWDIVDWGKREDTAEKQTTLQNNNPNQLRIFCLLQ